MKNLFAIAAFVGLAGALGAGLYLAGSDSESSDTLIPVQTMGPEDLAEAVKHSHDTVVKPEISASGPWPKAVVETTDYQFGRMQIGQELTHTFTIRNEGEAALELEAGEPTCKCTGFSLTRDTVPPGETAELKVSWKGQFADPMFQHGGPVYTNDPEHNPLRFTVRGIVDHAVQVKPEGTWDVGEVPSDNAATMTAGLYSNVFEDMTITSVSSKSDKVTFSTNKLDEDNVRNARALSGYEINVSVSPEIPPGVFEDEVTIEVAELEEPVVVALKAYKPGQIRILPTAGVAYAPESQGVALGRFPVTQGRSAKLLLLVDEAEMESGFELTEVTTDPSFIEVELTSAGATAGTVKRYFLTITIPPGIPRTVREAGNSARIVCQTNHPTGESLLIKLKFNAF